LELTIGTSLLTDSTLLEAALEFDITHQQIWLCDWNTLSDMFPLTR
jgi:hypothetical protein